MKEYFPDGTLMEDWFHQAREVSLEELGRAYVATDYGIADDGQIYTEAFQALIDRIALEGGGVLVVPAGTYRTGSIFFRQGVHLYVAEGGVLMGSDDIADYALLETRIEGETCMYFAAMINADGVDGFTMAGPGAIDGNGFRSWRAFWLRRKWNPRCTNKDEQRPRLVYISNSRNVLITRLHLRNSHFWTTHLYRCDHVRYLNCTITCPFEPVKPPSTDAIDIDVCTDVHIKGCYMEVNDDAVVLKGGKGPWADTAPENGSNERILVEDCRYGRANGLLTIGSESVHDRNVILRRLQAKGTNNLLNLKMRPDTPQHYEHVLIQDVRGSFKSFLNINPWMQFYNLKDREDIPMSYADHISIEDCRADCRIFFNVKPKPDQYDLSSFTFRNLVIRAKEGPYQEGVIRDAVLQNVQVVMEEEE